jgi:protein-L-isoaspartate(D-aspartate) O-methyltransferase
VVWEHNSDVRDASATEMGARGEHNVDQLSRQEFGDDAFLLHLREPDRPDVREVLAEPRLERAIGVIYRPENELQSHYFQARLPHQFDEYVWIDETTPVTPLAAHHPEGLPDTYPFGL